MLEYFLYLDLLTERVYPPINYGNVITLPRNFVSQLEKLHRRRDCTVVHYEHNVQVLNIGVFSVTGLSILLTITEDTQKKQMEYNKHVLFTTVFICVYWA